MVTGEKYIGGWEKFLKQCIGTDYFAYGDEDIGVFKKGKPWALVSIPGNLGQFMKESLLKTRRMGKEGGRLMGRKRRSYNFMMEVLLMT